MLSYYALYFWNLEIAIFNKPLTESEILSGWELFSWTCFCWYLVI